MKSYFKPGELPGGRSTRSLTDVATWQQVWDTAEFVYQRCVENEKVAGWGSAGEPENSSLSVCRSKRLTSHIGVKNSIGVFIWSTGSLEDITVEADNQFSAGLPRNDSISIA
jgi:hypothetical protein